MELNLEKFSPTVAELSALAEQSRAITSVGPFDKEGLRAVKDMRIKLRDARVDITKTGKFLREDALKFQKAVIAKEKQLVKIIEPEEERLAALEDEAEQIAERHARTELLPRRKERLASIGDGIEVSDDELLDMDGPAFEDHFNKRQANKNEADRKALEEREAALRAEEIRQQREIEMREREEKAREEERERIEREQKEQAEREQREKEAAQKRAKEEQERLEREGRYQAFLSENGYTAEIKDGFHIERTAEEVRLYKLVGTLKLK